MANLAIKGHATRGKEVIGILEMLGGVNNKCLYGITTGLYYFIDYKEICSCESVPDTYIIFTLEDFLEKFPYKVGDKVIIKAKNQEAIIDKIVWCCNTITYWLKYDGIIEGNWRVEHLQPYKEETLEVTEEFYNKHCVNCGSQRCTHNGEWLKECEHYKEETTNKAIFEGNAQSCDISNEIIKKDVEEIKIDIPNGYEFFGIDDDNKIVLTKIQSQYPKTYEECCKELGHPAVIMSDYVLGYKGSLLNSLQELLICRDAYWKIGGDWKYDVNKTEEYFYIVNKYGRIVKEHYMNFNHILAFPTAEMRDAFYENFKDLIERCKELL